jgi:hypothetical protein
MRTLLTLDELRKLSEAQFSKWRSIWYYIDSADFKFCYDNAPIEERKKLRAALVNGDQDYFKNFVKKKRQDLEPFQKLGVRKLKNIAKYLRIPNWYAMNKITLIEAINDEVHRIKADSYQIIDQSEE